MPESQATVEVPRRPRYRRAGDLLGRVVGKALDDNIFFMAGAIAFNLVIAVIPLLILSVGVAGFVVRARFEDPTAQIIALLLSILPAGSPELDLVGSVRPMLDRVVESRADLSVVGAVALVWISTRLVGTLRTVVREVFDVGQQRGILRGKLYDAQMVLVGGMLLLVNFALTVGIRAARDLGGDRLGLGEDWLSLFSRVTGVTLAFLSIWTLFLLVYRYLPARRVPWKTVLVAASFAAVAFEAMKLGFGWYIRNLANYRTAYGNFTTLIVLGLYLYYLSVTFILGGEIGQVYTMRRALGASDATWGGTKREAGA